MGEVYKAEDTTLRRPVAIKRLHPELAVDPVYRKRFLQEARHAARISHQGIAGIHDVLEEQGELFLVMEYVKGETLAVKDQRQTDIDFFLSIAEQCVSAVAAAHEEGIIHRDLKPGNIIVTPTRAVKVLDFGLARRIASQEELTTDSFKTSEGKVRGTPAYMSPEVLRGGEADHRSDIFSLGVVFYEMLTGHHPFLDRTAATTAHRILSQQPPPMVRFNPEVPEAVERIVMKMLEKDPGLRYASTEDLLTDLRRSRRDRDYTPVVVYPPEPEGHGRRWLAFGLLVIAAVMLLAIPPSREKIREFLLPLPERIDLAVLPFSSPGDTEHMAALALGLSEVLSRNLAPLGEELPLNVIPQDVVRECEVGIEGISWGLGANLGVTGRVSQFGLEGDRVKVELRLVDAQRGWTLRRVTVDGLMSEPNTLVYRLTQDTARMLDLEWDPLRGGGNWVPMPRTSAGAGYLRGLGYLWYYHSLAQDFDLDEQECRDKAITDLQAALDIDPTAIAVKAALGRAMLRKHLASESLPLMEQASILCEEARASDGLYAEANLCLAELAREKGDEPSANAFFKEAYRADRTSVEILMALGESYWLLGLPDDCLRVYRTAVQGRDGFWYLHSVLGSEFFYRSMYKKALGEFKRVVEMAPDYHRGWSNLGATYGELFQYDEAIEAFERAREIQPSFEKYTNIATHCFYAEDFEGAVWWARKAIAQLDLDNESERAYLNLGNLAECLYWAPGGNERGAARIWFEKAEDGAKERLRHAPHDVNTLGHLALYQAILNKRSESVSHLDEALKLDPGTAETLFKGALIHQHFGETNLAVDYLDRALSAGLREEKIRRHPLLKPLCTDKRLELALRSNGSGK